MKNLTILLVGFLALVCLNPTIAQDNCLDLCLEECYDDEDKCIEKAQLKYNECTFKCRKTYPFGGDHGYYGDVCLDVCDMELEEAIAECIFYGDQCIDVCDQSYDPDCVCDECPTGFTYNASLDMCVYTIPNGYTVSEQNGNLYLVINCGISTANDCCPSGYSLAVEQACTDLVLSEECQDLIDEIEFEAALDEAQGDPIDWNWVDAQIQDILDDPDCYVTETSNCTFCYSSIISDANANAYTIEGNQILRGPACP